MKTVEHAKKWVGYLEHQTNDLLPIHNANVGKGRCTIFADIIARHYRWRIYTGLPWCAVFIHAIFLEAFGKEPSRAIIGKTCSGTRVLARQMERKGFLRGRDYIPRAGDLIFLTNNPEGSIGHCGIVEKVVGDTIFTIEGNSSDPTGHFEPRYGGAVVLQERLLSDPKIVNFAEIPYQDEGSG